MTIEFSFQMKLFYCERKPWKEEFRKIRVKSMRFLFN